MTFPEELDMGSFIDIEDEVIMNVQLFVFKNDPYLLNVILLAGAPYTD